MKTYFFKGLLQNEGWLSNAYVSIDEKGLITAISQEYSGEFEALSVYAIPGFQNAHSHAFQYAMAGLAEIHSTEQAPDDFWSWRDAMYRLALTISPDQVEVIARQLYAEMLRHGYTDVAEFHYIHHDQNGAAYSNLSEIGERLISAAKSVGIGITLVPIFYQKGGFGKDPTDAQRRFISQTSDDYYRLLEASEASCNLYEHANAAVGIHSMRAVDPNTILEIARSGPQQLPFHIHISEQLKEIEDCLAYLNKRPVEWMLDELDLSDRFHLVHATHLDESETKRLASSSANVVLCPSTEGNLGDGIFPLRTFQEMGGSWSIGTDSHVGLNPLEEFRVLDYGQRLTTHKRNTFYSKAEGDAGKFAIDMSLKAGRKAMGNYNEDYFKIGASFDAALIRADAALLESSSFKNMTASMLFSSDSSMQWGVIAKGKIVVKEGRHINGEEIKNAFVSTINQLGNRQ